MSGRDEWMSLAESADETDLRERILTGFKDGKPFTPYVPTIGLPSPAGWVLDFGCGLGRNFPYLRTIAENVAGFDLPPMIARCRTLGEPVSELLDDWDAASTRRFDLIFASLVLQHLDPAACRQHLADFARMAPAVYLLTRTNSDFGEDILDIVAESGWRVPGPCVEVDHDPATHQLRVLASRTFDEARQSAESTHYEMLLR